MRDVWGRDFALFECKRVARFFVCDVDADERADWIDNKRRELESKTAAAAAAAAEAKRVS